MSAGNLCQQNPDFISVPTKEQESQTEALERRDWKPQFPGNEQSDKDQKETEEEEVQFPEKLKQEILIHWFL